jgi:hypothetical protein
MSALSRFAAFWYDFIIGDDWRVAVVVLAALLLTAFAVRGGFAAEAWLILPIASLAVLAFSVVRASR